MVWQEVTLPKNGYKSLCLLMVAIQISQITFLIINQRLVCTNWCAGRLEQCLHMYTHSLEQNRIYLHSIDPSWA
jgi:hypothetical protein